MMNCARLKNYSAKFSGKYGIMALPEQNSFVEYQKTAPEIHEFTILKTSRRAVDEFVAIMRTITDSYPPHTPIYVLLDNRQGEMPIHYLAQRLRETEKEYPNRGSIISASVVSHSVYMLFPVLEVALRVFAGHDTRRAFTDYDEARAWLITAWEASQSA